MTDRGGGDLTDVLAASADTAWARQVHGARVVEARGPGCAGEADALVTTVPGLRIAVRAADCGPLVLSSAAEPGGPGAVGVAPVGWRGARRGVVAAAADALRRLSGTDEVLGWLGPCIGPCCYEFGADDLDDLADALGDGVRATTTAGAPALDLPAAVASSAVGAGVRLVGSDGRCTACSSDRSGRPAFFSHRARGEIERHGVLACLR